MNILFTLANGTLNLGITPIAVGVLLIGGFITLRLLLRNRRISRSAAIAGLATIALFFGVSVLTGSLVVSDPCQELATYLEATNAPMSEFILVRDEVSEFGFPRSQASDAMEDVVALRSEIEKLDPPDSAEEFHANMLAFMGELVRQIEGFGSYAPLDRVALNELARRHNELGDALIAECL